MVEYNATKAVEEIWSLLAVMNYEHRVPQRKLA